MQKRLNAYRSMWVMVVFDLPTETKKERRDAALFRKNLIGFGFTMFQYSVYMRHCPSMENASYHSRRVKSYLPDTGYVGIFYFTDKQWGMTLLFQNKKPENPESGPQQLELF